MKRILFLFALVFSALTLAAQDTEVLDSAASSPIIGDFDSEEATEMESPLLKGEHLKFVGIPMGDIDRFRSKLWYKKILKTYEEDISNEHMHCYTGNYYGNETCHIVIYSTPKSRVVYGILVNYAYDNAASAQTKKRALLSHIKKNYTIEDTGDYQDSGSTGQWYETPDGVIKLLCYSPSNGQYACAITFQDYRHGTLNMQEGGN